MGWLNGSANLSTPFYCHFIWKGRTLRGTQKLRPFRNDGGGQVMLKSDSSFWLPLLICTPKCGVQQRQSRRKLLRGSGDTRLSCCLECGLTGHYQANSDSPLSALFPASVALQALAGHGWATLLCNSRGLSCVSEALSTSLGEG